MGGSQSCSLCQDDLTKKEVIVMKEDGEAIMFKEGTSVKEVLETNPYHKVIRCCSDRSVLPESFQLSRNWLYFLLPEGLAVNDTTYKSLIRAAISKGLIISRFPIDQMENEGQEVVCKLIIVEDDEEQRKSTWKPSLDTIKEIKSPPKTE